MRFVFDEVLDAYGALQALPTQREFGADLGGAILEEAAKLAENVLAPVNGSGDKQGCQYDPVSKTVKTPEGFKAAYKQFAEGGWTLSPKGEAALAKIAPTLAGLKGQQIVVEGFTDNVPIGPALKARFPSNWHLSQARADAVAAALAPQLGARAHIKTEGSADSEPLMSNDTPDGRAQNRRVEIIVFPAAPRTRVE